MPSLASEIQRRSQISTELAELNVGLVENYGLNLTVDNFSYNLFLMYDASGRSVSVVKSEVREGKVHTAQPRTDILVFATGTPPVIIGWTTKDRLQDAEDRFIVSTKSLFPMPNTFNFAVPCPHMEIYGGFWNEEERAWECYGCGRVIARTTRD